MSSDLIINAAPYEVRIALVENGNLAEFYLERPVTRGLVGNIYRGRVVRVLPGMQAAFVDIGLERTGFLHVDDVLNGKEKIDLMMNQYGEHICCDEKGVVDISHRQLPSVSIADLLTEGQDILVQICKEPLGSKGARLTCHITVPCRNLVFMPMTDHIGISRKIEHEDLRNKLMNDIEELRPAGMGFIVRTVAANATSEDLEADMEFLLHLWSDEIQEKVKVTEVPGLVYEDLDVILRVVRDVLSTEVDKVIVDDQATYQRVLRFVDTFIPAMREKITYYDRDIPLFDLYGLEVEITRAMDKKIWLRCGGYIIIEMTEALTVIDVNTGRYVGKNDLEETIFKTNMEAAKEIAYQLRLRNIGGIIIIDFIDMELEKHREEVFLALNEALKNDKSKVNILKVSEFGLVQMTRKRNREPLALTIGESCSYCRGEGLVKSRRTICYEIFRKLSRLAKNIGGESITVKVHNDVAAHIIDEEAQTINQIEALIKKRITIVPTRDLHVERYEIFWNN